MKEFVQVNGVTLTRAQVQEAMQKLDEIRVPKCLDRVRSNHASRLRGVVITGQVQKSYVDAQRREGNDISGNATIVSEVGGGHTFDSSEGLPSDWEYLS